MSRVLVSLLVVMMLLTTGCKKSDNGSGSLFSSADSSGFAGGSDSGNGNYSGSGSGNAGGGASSGGSSSPARAHNPEPATLALLGAGLVAYMLLKRKKK